MKRKCPFCGSRVPAQAEYCQECGTRLTTAREDPWDAPEEHRESGSANARMVRIAIAWALCLAVAGIVVAITGAIGGPSRDAQTRERFAELYDTMYSGACEAEDALFRTYDVWINSVYEIENSTTDLYTREDWGEGAFYEDYNDALKNLYGDESYQDQMAAVYDAIFHAEQLIEQLEKQHSEAFEREFDDFENSYNLFLEFTNLAIDPGDSLQDFVDVLQELDGKMADAFDLLDIYFEE